MASSTTLSGSLQETGNLIVGILTVSDRCSQGKATDESGPALEKFLTAESRFKFAQSITFVKAVVPDEIDEIQKVVRQWSDDMKLPLILTTGGTGFAPRDQTPEAIRPLLHKEAPGLQVAMIQTSLAITHHAMLSRPIAGIRNSSLIVTLPGSPKGAVENLAAINVALPHALSLMLDLKNTSDHKHHHQHKNDHHAKNTESEQTSADAAKNESTDNKPAAQPSK